MEPAISSKDEHGSCALIVKLCTYPNSDLGCKGLWGSMFCDNLQNGKCHKLCTYSLIDLFRHLRGDAASTVLVHTSSNTPWAGPKSSPQFKHVKAQALLTQGSTGAHAAKWPCSSPQVRRGTGTNAQCHEPMSQHEPKHV